MMKEEFRSRVYTDRPDYADFDAPAKFNAIQSIIAKRLREHPNAICSYSGGSDSDIMIDLIERTRKIFDLPPVKYVFFNTGLEMKAIKDHVRDTAEKYGVEIEECRPKANIVQATIWRAVCIKDYVCWIVRMAKEECTAINRAGIRSGRGQAGKEGGTEREIP